MPTDSGPVDSPAIDVIEHALHTAGDIWEEEIISMAEAGVEVEVEALQLYEHI
jgi:hypothetical protein